MPTPVASMLFIKCKERVVAVTIPTGFDLTSCRNREERTVISALQSALSDSWIIVPNFMFRHGYEDGESDVVLIHPKHGIVVIEVKGGRIALEKGNWVGTDKDPVAQMRRNSYAVRDLLRREIGDQYLQVRAGIWLPSATKVKGKFPPGLTSEQLLIDKDLIDPESAIVNLCSRPFAPRRLTAGELTAIVDFLAPTAELSYDTSSLGQFLRSELDVISETQVVTLASLDAHHRVVVTGRAGTGKTHLATTWMRRGLMVDEDEEPARVLLTCYNDPLAIKLTAYVTSLYGGDEETMARVTVGAFLRTMLTLEGMPPLKIRDDEDGFWSKEVPAHLMSNWHRVSARFDRIIVDEAQDFSPAWLGLLESLLDPEGANQFFLLADPHQQLVDRGFVLPSPSAGWVSAELPFNVRNAKEIARVARRHLDGSVGASRLPAGDGISGVVAPRMADVVTSVNETLRTLYYEGIGPQDILVVASDTATRDHLRSALNLGIYGVSPLSKVVCETAHRAKGLEYDVAIVAVGVKPIRDTDLYIAVTRAIRQLIVVGPAAVLDRLGLAT